MAAYILLMIFVLFSAAPTAQRRRGWAIVFASSLFCSLASIYFAGISAFLIGSWCILCIAIYGINFLLSFLSWVTLKRFNAEPLFTAYANDLRFLWANIKWTGPVFALLAIGVLISVIRFPAYWDIRHPGPSAQLKNGMTAEGFPWIGAESPELEIVEFTDYQCFQCRKMHHHLLQLLARYPGKIRVVHRHFPMDNEFNPIVGEPFHVGSGRMAILAIHAAFKGKFVEMNDWLFLKAGTEPGTIPLAEAAAATGIDARELAAALQHAPYRLLLKRDIHEGLRLGIVGTPSYVINGQVYEGNLPADVLQPLLKSSRAE